MRYLLVNHIPIGRGTTPGSYVFGDMWLEDLRAQADALAGAGMRLTLAAPLVDQLAPMSGGSFNNTQIVPSERGFDFFPLPFYQSARQYFRVRGNVVFLEAVPTQSTRRAFGARFERAPVTLLDAIKNLNREH